MQALVCQDVFPLNLSPERVCVHTTVLMLLKEGGKEEESGENLNIPAGSEKGDT